MAPLCTSQSVHWAMMDERRVITLNPGSGYLDVSAFNPLVVTIFRHLRLQSLTSQSV